jgi:hypothetical protein
VFVLDSLEVRWFVPPDDPAEAGLSGWFSQVPIEDDGRADWYLRTDTDALGIKSRTTSSGPARFETKFRLGALGATHLAPGVVGAIEQWRKLSTTSDDPTLKGAGEWVRVAKSRRLRKLAYDGGQVAEIEPNARAQAGCSLELTALQYTLHGRAGAALTFGFEAFGARDNVLQVLLRTAETLLSGRPELELRAEWSMGYPQWLQHITRDVSS